MTSKEAQLKSHFKWKPWMRHFVFVDDQTITGYAPDNSILVCCEGIDEFFHSYEVESKKWEKMYG
jgi:hypothetical protein